MITAKEARDISAQHSGVVLRKIEELILTAAKEGKTCIDIGAIPSLEGLDLQLMALGYAIETNGFLPYVDWEQQDPTAEIAKLDKAIAKLTARRDELRAQQLIEQLAGLQEPAKE